MGVKTTNNASTTLAAAITSGATSLQVAAGQGALFPTLGAGEWFPCTLIKSPGGAANREIVRVTARATDVFTITRAQEGTTALAFSGGDMVELRPTAAVLASFAQTSENATFADVTVDDLTADEVRGTRFIDKTVTNASATGTVTLDCSTADMFDLTTSGNTTVALSNLPALSGETFTFKISVAQGSTAYSLTWFANITWLTTGGAAPAAPAANKTIEYIFTTKDGTNFIGRKGASN